MRGWLRSSKEVGESEDTRVRQGACLTLEMLHHHDAAPFHAFGFTSRLISLQRRCTSRCSPHTRSTQLTNIRHLSNHPPNNPILHLLLITSTNPPTSQVFPVSDKLYIGLSGLATDTYTLRESLRFRVNMYRMKEEREITPETFTHLVSSTLYEKR